MVSHCTRSRHNGWLYANNPRLLDGYLIHVSTMEINMRANSIIKVYVTIFTRYWFLFLLVGPNLGQRMRIPPYQHFSVFAARRLSEAGRADSHDTAFNFSPSIKIRKPGNVLALHHQIMSRCENEQDEKKLLNIEYKNIKRGERALAGVH